MPDSLGGELYGPFDRGRGGPGGWVILDEPELHLSGDALVPDLGGWRRERMSALPEATAFELAPDWVPAPRTLEVLRWDGGSYRIVGAWHGDAIDHAEPFEVHSLHLADLWSA